VVGGGVGGGVVGDVPVVDDCGALVFVAGCGSVVRGGCAGGGGGGAVVVVTGGGTMGGIAVPIVLVDIVPVVSSAMGLPN
jgi:hypothetical protein